MADERQGAMMEREEQLFGGQRRLKRHGRQNERRQRQRTTTAGKRQGVVVEAEEQLFCSGGGFTIKSWRMKVKDRRGTQAGVFIILSFFGGVEPYLES